MKKKIKAPGTFPKISAYIAAIFFALYAFLYTVAHFVAVFVFKYNYSDISPVLFVIVLVLAAILLLFKQVKLLPIPFALLGGFEAYWFINAIVNLIKYSYSPDFSFVMYRLYNLSCGFGALLMILLAIFAAIKATRKITVVWFIPAIFYFIGGCFSFIVEAISIADSIINGYIGHRLEDMFLFDIPEVIYLLLMTVAVVFTGLAVRAYAKQQMFNAQEEASFKDETVNG